MKLPGNNTEELQWTPDSWALYYGLETLSFLANICPEPGPHLTNAKLRMKYSKKKQNKKKLCPCKYNI